MEILVAVILLCGIIMLLRSAYEFTKKKRHTAATLQVGHIYQTRCGEWSVEIFFDDLLAPFSSGGVAQNLTTGHKTLHSWIPDGRYFTAIESEHDLLITGGNNA